MNSENNSCSDSEDSTPFRNVKVSAPREACDNIGQLYQRNINPKGKKDKIKLSGSGVFYKNRVNNPVVISYEDEEDSRNGAEQWSSSSQFQPTNSLHAR